MQVGPVLRRSTSKQPPELASSSCGPTLLRPLPSLKPRNAELSANHAAAFGCFCPALSVDPPALTTFDSASRLRGTAKSMTRIQATNVRVSRIVLNLEAETPNRTCNAFMGRPPRASHQAAKR